MTPEELEGLVPGDRVRKGPNEYEIESETKLHEYLNKNAPQAAWHELFVVTGCGRSTTIGVMDPRTIERVG